ncbi:hypothetical protein FSARC_7188 [Fusarium sarcochroum]|uniref:Uncharacterized protein n=1 Tax=Fusarium sarcochroum TaxID=1208366 RepID=A0A8H4TVN5_9HYPO|nr:hypothetical protein FSARC_7188 [Fusarium sarcochroum]
MERLSGPVLLSGLLMSSVVYWHAFFIVDYLLLKYTPVLYERLRHTDRLRKLCLLILVIVRMTFGLTVSLPACIQAARTTPWGVDQPLNTAGKVCVVSQLAVWSNELPLIRFYSLELFIHHLLCLVATSNIILSPPTHQIKPLYIYLASLVGDIGPGSVMILRLAGHNISTSRLMYYVALGSTSILIFCRIGCAFYTLTHVLTDPYSLVDWVWVCSVLLFSFYSIYSAGCNLRWLGIIKVDPVRYHITYFSRFIVPISHSFIATACGTTLLSTLFLYGLYLDRPLKPLEIGLLSMNGLVATAFGLTWALVVRILYPHSASKSDPWGRLYLPLGTVLTGVWVWAISTQYTRYVARETILASSAINVPLFYAIAKVAQYYSAKDAAAAYDEKPPWDEGPIKRHLEMARENVAIFVISLALLASSILSLSETARLAIATCLVVQLRLRCNIVPLAAANLSGIAGFWMALLILVLEPGFLIFAITAPFIRCENPSGDIMKNYLLLGGTLLVALTVSREKAVSKSCEAKPKSCRIKKFHLITLILVFLCILQVIMVRKYLLPEERTPEISVGFKNFRSILSNPFTWLGVLQMSSLPVIVLRGMK